MSSFETVARVRVGRGVPVERLVCHPRLPLLAGLDSECPAVHVWDYREQQTLETIGAGSTPYKDRWQRMERRPTVAWHPDKPLLLVAGEDGVMQWARAGLSKLEGLPPDAAYHRVMFSPDGRTLWASPASGDVHSPWNWSDGIDLTSGTVVQRPHWGTEVGAHPYWLTEVAVHPAGGLVAMVDGDQGSGTLVLFARVDQESTPVPWRVLRRAAALLYDGYETPIFSQDGRHIAIRGSNNANSLDVFQFPSLDHTLKTYLEEPMPDYRPPRQWYAKMLDWPRHNIAFGPQPGVLWVGTQAGTLFEVDLDNQGVVEHQVFDGSPVTALSATATGELVAATGEGDIRLLAAQADSIEVGPADADAGRALVTAFLDATSELHNPSALVVTRRKPTWAPEDLATAATQPQQTPPDPRLGAANGICTHDDDSSEMEWQNEWIAEEKEQTVAAYTRELGLNNPNTLFSVDTVAQYYSDAGRSDELVALREHIFADQEQRLGADHLDTLTARHDLACAYKSVGRLDEAISLHAQTLATRTQVLGPDHRDTLASSRELADTYTSADRLDEAIILGEQTLIACGSGLGPEDEDTLVSCLGLVGTYRSAQRPDDAIECLERTAAAREEILGENDMAAQRLRALVHNINVARGLECESCPLNSAIGLECPLEEEDRPKLCPDLRK